MSGRVHFIWFSIALWEKCGERDEAVNCVWFRKRMKGPQNYAFQVWYPWTSDLIQERYLFDTVQSSSLPTSALVTDVKYFNFQFFPIRYFFMYCIFSQWGFTKGSACTGGLPGVTTSVRGTVIRCSESSSGSRKPSLAITILQSKLMTGKSRTKPVRFEVDIWKVQDTGRCHPADLGGFPQWERRAIWASSIHIAPSKIAHLPAKKKQLKMDAAVMFGPGICSECMACEFAVSLFIYLADYW